MRFEVKKMKELQVNLEELLRYSNFICYYDEKEKWEMQKELMKMIKKVKQGKEKDLFKKGNKK